jgi:3-dehydroquinate synthetase
VIRTTKIADTEKLKELYRGSIYEGLPELVKWALLNDPDRVLLNEKRGTLLAAV